MGNLILWISINCFITKKVSVKGKKNAFFGEFFFRYEKSECALALNSCWCLSFLLAMVINLAATIRTGHFLILAIFWKLGFSMDHTTLALCNFFFHNYSSLALYTISLSCCIKFDFEICKLKNFNGTSFLLWICLQFFTSQLLYCVVKLYGW